MVKGLEDIISRYDIPLSYTEVENIENIDDGFGLVTDKGYHKTEYLVLATGTTPRSLGFQEEIYHPRWRDPSGKKVVIIGGGDAAYDYALRVNRLGGDVIISRRSEPSALPVLIKEAKYEGIEERMGEPEEICRTEDHFIVQYDQEKILADLVITAIGREPNILDLDIDDNEISFPTGTTEFPGLFVVGSNVLGTYRQTSLCWGMGIAVGMKLGRIFSKQD